MKHKLTVLSLFDGISCGQLALKDLGYNESNIKYYASEIDKYSISVTQYNFPNTIQLGDINKWREWDIDFKSVDLILAGSPCQGFSFAGKELAFDDPRSKLFFVFVDILNHIKSLNPSVIFMLENVEMRREFKDRISEILNCDYVTICSSVLSAQKRKRLYWSNKVITLPQTKVEYSISDIVGCGMTVGRIVGRRLDNNGVRKDNDKTLPIVQYLELSNNTKSNCLTTVSKDNVISSLPCGRYKYKATDKSLWRYFTPEECEQLQTLPVGYTGTLPKSYRYKTIGNSWTVSVIKRILMDILN